MVILSNIPDTFFSEIRKVEIYKAEQLSHIAALNGQFPQGEPLFVIDNIIPEEFERSIKQKKDEGNPYYDIDINFNCYDSNYLHWEHIISRLNKQRFSIVLLTNNYKLIIGNEMTPLSIDVIDKRKDDNSGKDYIGLNIYGNVIIAPKYCPL